MAVDLGPDDCYGYSLDSGPPLPDPRSPWQPDGVHGLSRPVDHTAFPWTDGAWAGRPLETAVVYELHVGTFSPEGTFDGAATRLDHLVDLGVDVVELLPVAQFPGRHGWGYDGVDLYAPHDPYGGPDGLKRLVDACHARGLAVVIDVVYNHLARPGTTSPSTGPTSPTATRPPGAPRSTSTAPTATRSVTSSSATPSCGSATTTPTACGSMPSTPSSTRRRSTSSRSSTAQVEALSAELGRRVFLIAESDLNDPRVVEHPGLGGYGIDAQWSDDFHHALHAVLTGERSGYYADFGSLGHLAKSLRQAYVYDGEYSPHRRRRHGRSPAGIPPTRFLGYLQNHDQVGNRATGERSSALLSTGLLKVAAAVVLLARSCPCCSRARSGRRPRRSCTSPTTTTPSWGRPSARAAGASSPPSGGRRSRCPTPRPPRRSKRRCCDGTSMRKEPHAGHLDWHRRLIALRRSLPAVDFDDVDVRYDEYDRWLVLRRGPISVVCNLSGERRRVSGVDGNLMLASDDAVTVGSGAVTLPAESVAVLGR